MAELDRVYPDPSDPVRKGVVALLSTWDRMVMVDLKTQEDRRQAIDAFSALVQKRSIPEPEARQSENSPVWAPASQYYRMSTKARVRPDYASGDNSWKFNAREGQIVGVRGGYMIVKFDTDIKGAPSELRARPRDFEVDISHLSSKK